MHSSATKNHMRIVYANPIIDDIMIFLCLIT